MIKEKQEIYTTTSSLFDKERRISQLIKLKVTIHTHNNNHHSWKIQVFEVQSNSKQKNIVIWFLRFDFSLVHVQVSTFRCVYSFWSFSTMWQKITVATLVRCVSRLSIKKSYTQDWINARDAFDFWYLVLVVLISSTMEIKSSILNVSTLCSLSLQTAEADRDALDHSGKKPLDYQKQLTSISSATFSSEYKVMNNVIVSGIKTLPTRQSMMKKNRDKSAANVVQRKHSMLGSRGADDTKSIDSFDTRSMYAGETSTSAAGRFGSTTSIASAAGRRTSMMARADKKYRSSFLKKSLSRK